MKEIRVPYLSQMPDEAVLSEILEKQDAHLIDNEPWPLPGDTPQADFRIAYGDDAIFLKFKVKEKYIRALYQEINDPVYQDSCVEFFIGFNDDKAYYNFEFNCIGTPLVGYGEGRERELLPVMLISQIKREVSLKTSGPDFYWGLTLTIPFNIFSKHQLSSLKNQVCKGNFYKCGDELPEPHFLSWTMIKADGPNFHLPQYFGKLLFEY